MGQGKSSHSKTHSGLLYYKDLQFRGEDVTRCPFWDLILSEEREFLPIQLPSAFLFHRRVVSEVKSEGKGLQGNRLGTLKPKKVLVVLCVGDSETLRKATAWRHGFIKSWKLIGRLRLLLIPQAYHYINKTVNIIIVIIAERPARYNLRGKRIGNLKSTRETK